MTQNNETRYGLYSLTIENKQAHRIFYSYQAFAWMEENFFSYPFPHL